MTANGLDTIIGIVVGGAIALIAFLVAYWCGR